MKLPRGRDASSERLAYGLVALLALIVIYLVAFVLSNTTTVPVSFVFFETDASLIWVMLFCTLLGLVAGVAVTRLVAGGRSAGSGDGFRTRARAAATSRPAAARPAAPSARSEAGTDPAAPGTGSTAPPGGLA